MIKAYKYKLKPSRAQLSQLAQTAGARRFIYNLCVAEDRKAYAETNKGLSAFDLCYKITQLKKQEGMEWLRKINAQTLQCVTQDFQFAKQRFFKKLGNVPTFKSKHKDRARFKTQQNSKFQDGRVFCPSIGWLKVFGKREPVGVIKGGCYSQDSCGDWYVSLTVDDRADPPSPCDALESPLGIDLGLKDFITTSAGESIPAPKIARKRARKMARLQRVASRREVKSNRRKAAKLAVAKLHRKIANTRNNFQHQISSRLTNDYSLLCLETLNLKGLMKTKLAKSFGDAGLGELVRQLKYKAAWKGKHLVQVTQWFASSKLCSSCGLKNEALELKDRVWTCLDCGSIHDRDRNAALNLLNEGLKQVAAGHVETLNGRGADIRLSAMGVVGCEASTS